MVLHLAPAALFFSFLLKFLCQKVLYELLLGGKGQPLGLEKFERHQVIIEVIALYVIPHLEGVVADDVLDLGPLGLKPSLLNLNEVGRSIARESPPGRVLSERLVDITLHKVLGRRQDEVATPVGRLLCKFLASEQLMGSHSGR